MYLKRLLSVHKGVKKIPGNDNQINATNGNAKQEIKKRFPVFLRSFLSKAARKTRKEITGNFGKLCQIFLALRSNNDGKNIAAELAESPPRPSRVSAEAHT